MTYNIFNGDTGPVNIPAERTSGAVKAGLALRKPFSFLQLLTLLFVGLKLAGIGTVAGWSWWLVLLPLYAIPGFLLGMIALCVIGIAVIAGITAIIDLIAGR